MALAQRSRNIGLRRASILVAFLFCVSCKKEPPKVEAITEDAGEMHILPVPGTAFPLSSVQLSGDAKAAKDLYTLRCVMCHGWEGRGDGPSARMLGSAAKMPDFTNAAWQATKKDEAWAAVIVKGGEATGQNRLMPPNADLADKPGTVKELVGVLRSFSGKVSK